MRNSPREWDNDKYHNLQNRAFSKRNKERLEIIKNLEGEGIRQFFNHLFNDSDDYITSVVMNAIAEKLSQYDEPFLLDELEQIPKHLIKSWVSSKKREGYFFTEAVYEKAWYLYETKWQ